MFHTLLLGATLRPEGKPLSPGPKPLPEGKAGWSPVTQPLWLTLQGFCSPRGTIQGVERPRPLRRARPPAPALTLSMELSAGR